MIWIISIGCILGGAALGALLFKLYMSDEAKVKHLEEQLGTLSKEHEIYKSNVHNHFSNSADLLNRLTESYKDVYLHMADGARSLCPEYISSQLALSGDTRALLEKDRNPRPLVPPLDYATPSETGSDDNLDDDYGFSKITGKSGTSD